MSHLNQQQPQTSFPPCVCLPACLTVRSTSYYNHTHLKNTPPPPLQNNQRIFPVCMQLVAQLARRGLVHCDFNEFNLMINEAGVVTLIDFPQVPRHVACGTLVARWWERLPFLC